MILDRNNSVKYLILNENGDLWGDCSRATTSEGAQRPTKVVFSYKEVYSKRNDDDDE